MPVGATAQQPKSQSKMALKRQRAAAAQKAALGGGSVNAGVGQISFKKNLKLKLGGDAIDEEDERPQPASGSLVPPIEAENDDDPKPLAVADLCDI